MLTITMLGLALTGAVPGAAAFGMRGGRGFGGGPMGPGGPGGPGMPLRLLLSQMTTEQRREVRQVLASGRAERRATFERLHAAHEALADKLLSAGKVTEADLAPDLEKIAALHRELLAHGTKVMLQVRAVATPEQLAKAAQTEQKLDQLRDEIRELLGKDGSEDDLPPE
jgi:Spy/CpxP family protein refolding chaperone